MGMEELKKDILENARKEAESSIRDAKKEASLFQKQADKKIHDHQEAKASEKTKQVEQYLKLKESTSEFERRRMDLSLKKEMLDLAKAGAMENLASLPAQTRKDHIKKLLEHASGRLDFGKAVVSKNDKPFAGKDAEIADITGGLIAVRKDRTERLDLTYEALLDEIYGRRAKDISKLLFG